jgi:hypothetical protein
MTPRELPILFAGPMVRAIFDNRKTQTRRLVKLREFGPSDTTGYDWTFRDRRALWQDYRHADLLARVAPYRVGDRLYVRETFARNDGTAGGYLYRADYGEAAGFCSWNLRTGGKPTHHTERWTPSIHMPRCAARIWLRVERVRVERACDISEADARAEGLTDADGIVAVGMTPLAAAFRSLWIDTYGPAGWHDDPWVWVYDFARIEVSSC